MPFVNFRRKFRFFSFDCRQNFDVPSFPRWLSIRGTKFFLWAIQKNFLQNLHFGPIRWIPWWFFKLLIIYSQNLHLNVVFLSIFQKFYHAYAGHMRKRFYCMLIIRWTDFIAHWAYEERISAHAQPEVNRGDQFLHVQSVAEHTQNKFYRTLSIRGTNFIACWAYTEPISYGFGFCKKSKKNFMLVYL